MPSFWDYFIPISQSSIEGGKAAANEENTDLAHDLWDNASITLEQARAQTEQQIADRDSGRYDPDSYDEHGREASKYHPVYGIEDEGETYDRTTHRRNLENL